MLGVKTLMLDWIYIQCKEQKMEKYFVKKDGKFLNTILEFDSKYFPAEKEAEEWVAYEQRKNPGSTYELFSWDGWMNAEVVKKLEETDCFTKINWNWDKKYIPVRDDEEDWDIT